MSGICGLFHLDQSPVDKFDLQAMTTMLHERSPDAKRHWQRQSVGLGHTLLQTTTEPGVEKQPCLHEESGCVITADVRLDYRRELLGQLGRIDDHDSIGDAELILLAYLAWGETCLDRMLGDFAFAIWDPRQQTVFCARDHFGMRPLYYYHRPGDRFLFASDPKAILVLPQVPYRINEGRIADYLVPQLEWIDYTSTFFEGLTRLPPGHKMTVTTGNLDISEYWTPLPGPELGALSDDDYVQGFREVFSKAIEERLRGPAGRVGSMLSGGMDSGSVVSIAKELSVANGNGPLSTFSGAQRRGDDCAESRAIYSAIGMPSVSPTFVHPDGIDDLFGKLTSGIDEPFDGEFTILKAIYLAAQAQGQRVVLDGAGGDIVLSEGSYILRLIQSGHILRALNEISGLNKFWGVSPLLSDFLHFFGSAISPRPLKELVQPLRNRRNINEYLDYSTISPEFATRVKIRDRFDRMADMFPGAWHADYFVERTAAIRSNVAAGRERYARLAAAASIEARDPFLDRKVVDFCSRLPGRIRMQGGWPKTILRKMTENSLPDDVRWARGKPHLGSLFNAALTRQAIRHGAIDENRLQRALQNYVSPAKLRTAWLQFRDGSDTQNLHSAYVLSLWLRQNENRPVVYA